MFTTDQVYLLRKVSYQDKHCIYTFFGKHSGKFSLMAYSAKSSLKRGLQVIDYLTELQIQSECKNPHRMATLSDVRVLQSYAALRLDYDKLNVALAWLNFINRALQEAQVMDCLYQNLTQALQSLNDAVDLRQIDINAKCMMLRDLGFNYQSELNNFDHTISYEQFSLKLNQFCQQHLGFGF